MIDPKTGRSAFVLRSITALKLSLIVIVMLIGAHTRADVAKEPLTVVTSIKPLALIVSDLVGDKAQVAYVVPTSADPHNFSLKISSRKLISDSAVLLWLGPDFEKFMEKAVEQKTEGLIVTASELKGIDWFSVGEVHSHGKGEKTARDLHIWLSPDNAIALVRALSESLATLLPEHSDYLSSRLKQLERDWTGLKQDVTRQLSPYRSRHFGVYHSAYGHFEKAFSIRSKAAVNTSPEQRVSARHLYRLQKTLKTSDCLIAEEDSSKTRKMANVLELPLVVSDPLGSRLKVDSYVALITQMGNDFVRCFQSESLPK